WADILISLWFIFQPITQPCDSCFLILHKNSELADAFHLLSLAVVLIYLLGQEEHLVTLWEAFGQSGLKVGGAERYRRRVADVEGDHSVVKDARIALGDVFELAATRFDHREVAEMSLDEIPRTFLGLAAFGKTLL